MDTGCSSCGYLNPLGARFCSSCGAPLAGREATADNTVVHDSLQAPTEPILTEPISLDDVPDGTPGMFVVRQGPKAGSRIHLDSETITIGRHPESDIFLDDVTVSRRHAEVRRMGDAFEVSDAGSLNGTYVNQTRVEVEQLNDGDELQVGKFKLVYVSFAKSQ